MEEYSVLHSFFERLKKTQLTEIEKTQLNSFFKKDTFKKKEFLMREGDVNTRHYFIESGLLRLYIIDQSGKEFNILFARERQWLGDLGTPAPTSYFMDALENTIVYSIDEEGFRRISGMYTGFASYIRKSYVFLQKRFVSILSKTAEENYEELIQNNPDLIQRLPQYQISSYLGVTPVFLSKILAKRAKGID